MAQPTFPAEWSVARGLAVYFAENGFSPDAYDAPMAEASLFGVKVRYPNTPAHRRALMAHDLHHVATGFGSDHVGEGETSAWETASGVSSLGWSVRAIVFLGIAVGFLLSPRRVLAAWRAGRAHRNLFAEDLSLDALERLSIGQLRARLGVPAAGLSTHRGVHDFAPSHPRSSP
jgi:ubiquinone biosynthesis protein Coq4